MIKVTLTNEILRYIIEIEQNRYKVSSVKLSKTVMNKLRKNSKKKSSYASNKIEGNPLSEASTTTYECSFSGKVKRNMAARSVGVSSVTMSYSACHEAYTCFRKTWSGILS